MGKSFYSKDGYAYSTDNDAPEFTDLGFGFNNPKFSDRILRLEILPDPPVAKLRNLIREEETSSSAEEDAELNSGSPSSLSSPCKVRTVHINSLILAARSPVFLKMFTNGMKESEEKTVTLSVHVSEEKALLDFLGFLYMSRLSPKAPSDVLDVLKLADRYQVTSCAKYCRRLMQEYPMTPELALAYEELPATIFAGVSFQAPMREATRFLNDIERNIRSHEDFSGRAHKLFPVKVTASNSPYRESIVYDVLIHRNWGKKYTQPFRVGRERFQLKISSTEATKLSRSQMTVALIRKPGGSPSGVVKVEYEFSVRSGTTGKFVNKEVRAFVIEGSGLYHLPEYTVPLNSGEYSSNGFFYFRVRVTAAVLLY